MKRRAPIAAFLALFEAAGCAHSTCLPVDRYVRLLDSGGEVVADIRPEGLKEPDGRFPTVIEFQGRQYERCWTQQGNTDAEERLWCEESGTISR